MPVHQLLLQLLHLRLNPRQFLAQCLHQLVDTGLAPAPPEAELGPVRLHNTGPFCWGVEGERRWMFTHKCTYNIYHVHAYTQT